MVSIKTANSMESFSNMSGMIDRLNDSIVGWTRFAYLARNVRVTLMAEPSIRVSAHDSVNGRRAHQNNAEGSSSIQMIGLNQRATRSLGTVAPKTSPGRTPPPAIAKERPSYLPPSSETSNPHPTSRPATPNQTPPTQQGFSHARYKTCAFRHATEYHALS